MVGYKRFLALVALVAFLVPATPAVSAKKEAAPAVVALSAEDGVFLVHTGGGPVRRVETGPVGFLFPGPGGILFAPDLVNGRTTILDFMRARVIERIVGVTVPRFGPWQDRYLIVAGGLTVLSYPERSLIWRMDGEFVRPWQVEVAPEGTSMLIFERGPEESGEAVLSAIDMMSKQVIRRRVFPAGLARFTIVPEVGLLAVADGGGKRIRLLDPHTFADVRALPVNGRPTDLAVENRGRDLFVAGVEGRILRWRLKRKKEEIVVKELDPVPVEGRALLLRAGPGGETLAAATDRGRLHVFQAKKGEIVGTWEVPAGVRDLVWCDPGRSGPLLPLWSDQGGEMGSLDPSKSTE